MRLPEIDPVYAVHVGELSDALLAGRVLRLDFQHPGCKPDSVTIWLALGETRQGGGGPLWRHHFASAPADHNPGSIYWMAMLGMIGQLSYRDGWVLTDRQQEAA